MAKAITDELTYVSFPINKWEKNDDGDLIVIGKATDGSVDSDEQIVDPKWSAKALADWIDTGGNVRVQHQAMRDPAGKGLSVEVDRDGDGGHWVKSLVVEPVAKRLVEKGILTAYSVGIARPVITRDPTGKARGGVVTGGSLAELSLVDRPANKNCGLMIAKSANGAKGDMELVGEVFGDAEFLAKASTEEDLLNKAEGGDSNAPPPHSTPDTQAPPAATSDDGDDGDDGSGGSSAATGSDSKPGDDDGKDGDDAVSKAVNAETAALYKSERQEWLKGEPSVKGVAGGTEYLAKRAEWMRWHSAGEAEGLDGTKDGAERWLAKRDFSAAERDAAADSGAAMKDGSFPIKTKSDLTNAIRLAGNAKDPDAARAHIKRRAAALGASDMIPDTWKALTAAELVKMIADGEMEAKTVQVMLGAAWADLEKAAGKDGTVGDSKDSTFAKGTKQCTTCKGDGKIKGGNMDCPDCNGKGSVPDGSKADDGAEVVKGSKDCGGCGTSYDADASGKFCANCGKKLPSAKGKSAKSAKKAARLAVVSQLAETATKAVEDGLLSQDAADELIATAVASSGLGKGNAPLPGSTKPVGEHREPDGGEVENMEGDAGLPTKPDATADATPASVETGNPRRQRKSAGDPAYTAARMHDLMCAAYDPAEALSGFPTLKTVSDGVDVGWFTSLATAAIEAGKTKKAARMTNLVEAAQSIKAADPAAVADGMGVLRKAFTDMYPNEHCSPADPPRPGSYQRPYLTAGHAAENAAHNGGDNIPPSAHTIAPEDFHRPLITDGHEADSPANKEAGDLRSDIQPVTGAARTYYSNAQREKARVALASLHDHIAQSFPDLCPMAGSKSVMPPGNGATNVPGPVTPSVTGGVPTVGKGDDAGPDLQALIASAVERYQTRLGSPLMSRKQLAKAAGRLGMDVVAKSAAAAAPTVTLDTPPQQPVGLSAAEMKALLSEQITPLAERYDNQLDDLRKQLDDIGSKPDPAMAPVRGALARAPLTEAVPVERRSLVDEAAAVANKARRDEETNYHEYVAALAKSPDPGVRESALAILDKMAGSPATT